MIYVWYFEGKIAFFFLYKKLKSNKIKGENMYKNQNTKGHGFFRKSKAYGLVCAIALAGAFTLATSQVSAEQVTT